MSAVDITRALQTVLQAALPDANVLLGIPRQFYDPVVLYCWQDGPPNDVMKTTDTVRRHHIINIHLLVLSTGDDQQAEMTFLDIADRLADAFNTNHRLLGTADNSTISVKTLGSQYVIMDQAEYRAAAWIWDAEETLTFVFA